MQFAVQTVLCLSLLIGVLATLTKGRTGTVITAAGIAGVMLAKHLWLPALFTLAILSISMGISLVKGGNSSGASPFVSRLAGSLILFLVFGIFFGPATSLILWLLISGLQLLPQLRPNARTYLFNTLLRCGLTVVWLGLGLYAVYGS